LFSFLLENQLDLKNREMFPSIGETKKKRIKPIPILSASGQPEAASIFGKVRSFCLCPNLYWYWQLS
jgi:hypothetical protein